MQVEPEPWRLIDTSTVLPGEESQTSVLLQRRGRGSQSQVASNEVSTASAPWVELGYEVPARIGGWLLTNSFFLLMNQLITAGPTLYAFWQTQGATQCNKLPIAGGNMQWLVKTEWRRSSVMCVAWSVIYTLGNDSLKVKHQIPQLVTHLNKTVGFPCNLLSLSEIPIALTILPTGWSPQTLA